MLHQAPLSVYLSLRYITMHVTKSTRPFPLHFCQLGAKQKLDNGEGHGTRLAAVKPSLIPTLVWVWDQG